jgi:ADP-heptose:LPS heptosyltransferase
MPGERPHRIFNNLKHALRRAARRRLVRGHSGEMLTPADLDPTAVTRCLIILPNWRMGNLLLATPIAQWLREGLIARGAQSPTVDLCSGGHFANLLEHNPHIRRHIEIPTAFHPAQRRALARKLAADQCDLVYVANYTADHLALRLALATRARYRVGAGEKAAGPLNILVRRGDKDAAITEQHRTVLEELGFNPDPAVDIAMISTPDELAEADRTIAGWKLGEGRRPLALFPMGHRIKQMTFTHWAAIITRLRADFLELEPIVFHGPKDAAKLRSLQRALGSCPIRAVAAPLRPFCALIERVAAAVSCDCGPLHVARAKRRPLVSLFTKDNHDKFAPRGPDRAILFDPAGPSPAEVSTALRRVLSTT